MATQLRSRGKFYRVISTKFLGEVATSSRAAARVINIQTVKFTRRSSSPSIRKSSVQCHGYPKGIG